jgi:hypothetical protein
MNDEHRQGNRGTLPCLEMPHGFSDAEVRSSLRALLADELADVVWALGTHLDHAADRAEEQWTRRVRPFIDRYWPQDKDHKSPALSAAFAELALKMGNEFPGAVAATKNFLTTMRDSHVLLYRLGEDCSHLVKAFPDAMLDLLDLTAPQADGANYGLREVLDCLSVARPEFRTDQRFQHLQKLA